MEEWWYIAEDGVTHSDGLAADEYLATRPSGPPVLRLYTYRSHCVLVGRFQNVDSEVNRAACLTRGIPIGRRPTGGGAIVMGEDQLGVAVAVPRDRRAGEGSVQALFERYGEGVRLGLRSLGIPAELGGKNDVEMRGRKIAGMGIWTDPEGGLLFHASVLVDLDVPLMLAVLNTPFEKISDKAVAAVSERVTTVRRELGAPVPVDAVREAVRAGFARALGVRLSPGSLTAGDRAAIQALEQERYLNPEWVDQPHLVPSSAGMARLKTGGGLLEVHVTLAGSLLDRVYIHGDFFATDAAVRALETVLRWVPAEERDIRATVGRMWDSGYTLAGVSPEELARCVTEAALFARRGALTPPVAP